MKMLERIKVFAKPAVNRLTAENDPVSPLQWVTVLLVMIAVRTFTIFAAQGLPDKPGMFVAIFFVQDFFFFLDALLLAWIWLALFLKVIPEKLSRLMLWGTWLVVIPPVIDLIGYGKVFWSFYLFNDLGGLWMQYTSFFGHLPPAIVYFGSKIACLLAVFATSLFVYYQTKKIWKAVVNGWVIYSIFFLMGSFPSWLAYVYYYFVQGKNILAVTIADVAALISSPFDFFGQKLYFMGWMTMIKMNFVYFLFSIVLILILMRLSGKGRARDFFGNFFQNSQVYLHLALFLFGFGVLGLGLFSQNFNAGFFSWIGFVVLLFSIGLSLMADRLLLDGQEGQKEQPDFFGEKMALLNLAAFIGFFVVGVKFFLLALIYRSLFSIYYQKQWGLDDFWLAKQFLRWTALFLSLIFGFMLLSQEQSLAGFPIELGVWLSLGLWIVFYPQNKEKMLKKASVVPFSEDMKKTALAGLVFLVFVSGAFVIHRSGLFGWAVFFGAVAFWAIEKEYARKEILIKALFLIYLSLGLVIL